MITCITFNLYEHVAMCRTVATQVHSHNLASLMTWQSEVDNKKHKNVLDSLCSSFEFFYDGSPSTIYFQWNITEVCQAALWECKLSLPTEEVLGQLTPILSKPPTQSGIMWDCVWPWSHTFIHNFWVRDTPVITLTHTPPGAPEKKEVWCFELMSFCSLNNDHRK